MCGGEAKKFQDDISNILSMMKTLRTTYDPGLYPVNILQLQETKWTKKMEDLITNATKLVDESKCNAWFDAECERRTDDAIKTLHKDVVHYVTELSMKLLTVNEVAAEPAPVQSSGSDSNQDAKKALINVDIDAEKISSDVDSLTIELRRFQDWSTAPDHEIEVAMIKIESWRERMKEIVDTLHSMKRSVLGYDLDKTKLQSATAAVSHLQSQLDICVEDIHYEDDTSAYTLVIFLFFSHNYDFFPK